MPKRKKRKLKKKINKFSKITKLLSKKQKKIALSILVFSCLALLIFLSSLIESPIDERPNRIDQYFAKYNMPLAGHGQTFVDVADSCEMDWRLLPAIAVQESTGGKFIQYNNPFGWGGAQIPFESFDHAIREVGYHLCGFNSSTSKWYNTTSTREKLYWYNGTVAPNYPNEVMWIMDQF